MDDPEETADSPVELELDGEDEEEAGLRDQLFRAKDQLASLAEGSTGQLEDSDLCEDLALQVKPYADRLSALHRLLNPIDRLIDKRSQLDHSPDDIASEVAQIEALSTSLDPVLDPAFLREVQAELGIIPRMVRRRTLVEALYDLIAAQLVLGLKLNQQTLDATSSGLTTSDLVCTYFSAEGIRFKTLPRTTSHPAIGVCPSL